MSVTMMRGMAGRCSIGTAARPGAQGGFTLLEILVAIVVLSIGLLGLAALQVVSLNNNQSAYYRSIATQQAYDMADRIRSNPAGFIAGEYDDLDETIPVAAPACTTTACTAAEMAVSDHARWNTNNQRLLPEGEGTVVGDDGSFVITVTWTEKTTIVDGVNEDQSFQTTMVP